LGLDEDRIAALRATTRVLVDDPKRSRRNDALRAGTAKIQLRLAENSKNAA
jgi:hypothetical protein